MSRACAPPMERWKSGLVPLTVRACRVNWETGICKGMSTRKKSHVSMSCPKFKLPQIAL